MKPKWFDTFFIACLTFTAQTLHDPPFLNIMKLGEKLLPVLYIFYVLFAWSSIK